MLILLLKALTALAFAQTPVEEPLEYALLGQTISVDSLRAGNHDESAVVTVELPTEVHAYTRIPLLSPRVRDTEVFVVHPQVARFVRHENGAFLVEHFAALREHETAYFAELERLAALQLDETMTRLAAGLPRYRVRFAGDGFEVVGPEDPMAGTTSHQGAESREGSTYR